MARVTAEAIVARYVLAAIGDPKDLLAPFESTIDLLTVPQDKLDAARGVLQGIIEAVKRREQTTYEVLKGGEEAVGTIGKAFWQTMHGWNRLADTGHKLFLAILQTLVLPPALRKKVEKAVKAYLKTWKPRTKAYGVEAGIERLDIYEKFMRSVRADLATAKEAIAKGKAHAEEGVAATKVRVGSFTLINTGGFDEKVMAEAIETMKKVEALARSSGLGAVCYGEVQVTNTIHKGNVLAFYLKAQDELFIRANVKSGIDVVQVVLHELGHRYEHKFLSGRRRDIEKLYHLLSGQERSRSFTKDLKHLLPPKGDEIQEKGKTYRVVTVVPTTKGYFVQLQSVDDPRVTARISLEGYLQHKGQTARNFDEKPDYTGFVTDYAKSGGPGENFAEMFSFYCMGRLPVLQSVPFEEVCFGKGLVSESARSPGWIDEHYAASRVAHRAFAQRVLTASP